MFAPEGMVSASKESVSYVLNNAGGGHASIIVIGGAEESLNAHPGSLTLNILKRKGFIKMALKYGYVSHLGCPTKCTLNADS